MSPDLALSDLAKVIQLSIAPVFLLTSLGTFLAVLNVRLSRIIDRARTLEARARDTPALVNPKEMVILKRRRKLVYAAIACATFAALIVCMLIACAFIVVLIAFLAEIRLALLDSAFDPRT